MIFKKKAIALPEGENLSLFAIDGQNMNLYIKQNGVKEQKLTLGQIVRCENLSKENQPYDAIFEFENFKCLCLGSNMTIVEK